MSNSWVIAGIAVLCLLCGFGGGSFVSGRKLDRCWAQAWDRSAATIRRGQLAKLHDGFVLELGLDGHPAWVPDPEREAYERLCAEQGVPPIAEMILGPPGLDEPELPGEATIVPNLGKFVADESTHVGERTEDPLRSTGGFIPELAAVDEAPAPTSPGAGSGSPGPVTETKAPQEGSNPSSGPGDPLFSGLGDRDTFALIQWELGNLARKAFEPFRLTEWRMA